MTQDELLERLRQYVMRITVGREYHLRQDLVQEGVSAGWIEWSRNSGRPPAYYFRAARNAVRSALRGDPMLGHPGRRSPSLEASTPLPEWDGDHPSSLDAYPSDWGHVRSAIAELSEDGRTIALALASGYQKKEIAHSFGRSPSWVSKCALPPIRAALLKEAA